MNQPAAALAIFKSGQHVATDGKPYTFSDADLETIASGYNPELAEAPLVVGHPKTDAPAYGWAKSLHVRDGVLYAEPHQVDAQFAELVNAGRMKKISASIYLPGTPGNPTPGKHYLRHIGFLGAQPPAVKGLPAAHFAEGAESVEFAMPLSGIGHVMVDLFQRIRDYFVEKDGVEAADRIIPQWQIRSIDELAQRDDTNSKASFAETHHVPTPETDMSQLNADFAEREQALNNQKAAQDQRNAAQDERERLLQEREKKALRQDATDFAEGLVATGQLLPRQRDPVVELLLALPAGTSLNFAEGSDTVSKPAAEVLRELLSSMPQQVDFSEKSGDPGQHATADFAAPAGTVVDQGRLELHQRALEYMRQHPNTGYMTAVKVVGS